MEALGEMFVMGDFNTVLEKDDVGELMLFGAERGRAELRNYNDVLYIYSGCLERKEYWEKGIQQSTNC